MKSRKSGVLLHITSLPNTWGIGDLGPSAYQFVDFLHSSKQKLWQVLPLGPTSFFGSPYAPYSAFAGNPYLISPELLVREKLLTEADLDLLLYDPESGKRRLLGLAYENYLRSNQSLIKAQYQAFCHANAFWLPDYALFMALKYYFSGASWTSWPEDIAQRHPEALAYWRHKLAQAIEREQFIQFLFYYQWQQLKNYAHKKQITLIGDLPLFVAHDSADVWARPELFALDQQGMPTAVAGVPPDYFSETGQLWGNPVYNWDIHRQEGFCWWIRRCVTLLKLVDLVRIDHFRGLQAYWHVPYGQPDAINGEWKLSPGNELLAALKSQLGYLPFIAEDLGFIDAAVINLRDRWQLPGMRVLQFAFEALQPNTHSPHEHIPNCVVYTGTHDNDTTVGWFTNATPEVRDYVCRYLGTSGSDIAWDMIRAALASPAHLAVIPLQDILSLDSNARMNTPGTSHGNWRWRYTADQLNAAVAQRLCELTELYGR